MTKTAERALEAAMTHYWRLKEAMERANRDDDVELDNEFWMALDQVHLTISANTP